MAVTGQSSSRAPRSARRRSWSGWRGCSGMDARRCSRSARQHVPASTVQSARPNRARARSRLPRQHRRRQPDRHRQGGGARDHHGANAQFPAPSSHGRGSDSHRDSDDAVGGRVHRRRRNHRRRHAHQARASSTCDSRRGPSWRIRRSRCERRSGCGRRAAFARSTMRSRRCTRSKRHPISESLAERGLRMLLDHLPPSLDGTADDVLTRTAASARWRRGWRSSA